MSIQSFLNKEWLKVEALFNALPADLQEAARIAVTITEAVKNFDDKNPEVADILTAIIPGNIDNVIVAWLRSNIPVVLTELRLVNTAKALSDPAQITSAVIDTINHLDGDVKSAFLHDLSVLIAQEVAKAKNNQLKWRDAVYIVEWYYQHRFKQTFILTR